MAEEAGSCQVFPRTVYTFGSCSGSDVRCRGVGHFDILHGSVDAFCDIPYLVCRKGRAGWDECLHAPAAGADIRKYRAEEGIVEQGAAHSGGFFVGVEVVYIYHYQP